MESSTVITEAQSPTGRTVSCIYWHDKRSVDLLKCAEPSLPESKLLDLVRQTVLGSKCEIKDCERQSLIFFLFLNVQFEGDFVNKIKRLKVVHE